MIAIVWVSGQSSLTIGRRNVMPKGAVGNLCHIAAFGVLGSFVSRALDRRGESAGLLSRTGKLALAFTLLFGISDEIHQYFVPGRLCSLFDAVLDTCGAAAALLLPWPAGESRPRSWLPALALVAGAIGLALLTGSFRPPGDDAIERALAALGFTRP